jgi:hypothetical protein
MNRIGAKINAETRPRTAEAALEKGDMTTRSLALDSSASRLVVRTRAVGMLARLAHDLELCATGIEARAEVDGETWNGAIDVPVAKVEVAGVLKGDRLDPNVLSSSDKIEILKKMREDAFRGAALVKVLAKGTSRDRAELTLAIGPREVKSSVSVQVRDDGDAIVVTGTMPLSLKSIGSREIKAPLGAFSVKDEIQIAFDLRFV